MQVNELLLAGLVIFLSLLLLVTHRRTAARQEELDRKRTLHHSVLARLQRELASTEVTPALLREFARRVAMTLQVDFVEILGQSAEDEHQLQTRAGVGWVEEEQEEHPRLGEGKDTPAGYAFLSGQPVVLEDFAGKSHLHVPAHVLAEGAVSGVCMPILLGAHPEGVLGIYTRTRRHYPPDELRFLEAVASLISEAFQRERTEERHRREMTHFRLFSEAAYEHAFCTLDPSGRFEEWNVSAVRLLGWSPEEILGQELTRLYPPEAVARDRPGRALRIAALEGHHEEAGYRVRKDGSRFWTDTVITALYGTGGRVRGYTLVLHDLTTHRQAQEAQQRLTEQLQEESRLSTVLTQLPVGVVIAEAPTGRVILWNQMMEDILRQPILPYTSFEEYRYMRGRHPDGRPYALEDWPLVRAVRKGETVENEEIAVIRGDGSQGIIMTNAAPVRDATGRALWGVSTLLDITERKQAERSLAFLAEVGRVLSESREPEEILRRIMRLTIPAIADDCGILLRPASGSDEWLAPEQEEGRSSRLLLELLQERVGAVLRTHRSKLVSKVTEERLREHHLVSYMIVPMMARGRTLGVILMTSTRPERRFSEQDLQTAEEFATRTALAIDNTRLFQQAQQAIHARDEVLSIVAHDLRNPLHAIELSTEALSRRVEAGRMPGQAGFRLITRSVQRMDRLINDLLDVAHLEGGMLTVETSPQPATALMQEAFEAARPLAHELRLELRDGEVLPLVQADRERVLQVFSNLLGNALKFTPPGGTVTMGARCEGDAVCFFVHDTGPGIPQEALVHLFDRFWQARRGDRRGTGLGLYIAKGLVEAQGGRIWAESEPGQGSTFFFSLPIAHGAPEHYGSSHASTF